MFFYDFVKMHSERPSLITNVPESFWCKLNLKKFCQNFEKLFILCAKKNYKIKNLQDFICQVWTLEIKVQEPKISYVKFEL